MRKLGFQFFGIIMDFFHRLQLAFRLTAAGIADSTGTAADDDIRMMALEGKPFQHHKGNKMSYMKTVTSRIDAAIQRNFLFVSQFAEIFFFCHLIDGSTPSQFVNNIHGIGSLSS